MDTILRNNSKKIFFLNFHFIKIFLPFHTCVTFFFIITIFGPKCLSNFGKENIFKNKPVNVLNHHRSFYIAKKAKAPLNLKAVATVSTNNFFIFFVRPKNKYL